MKYDKLTVKAQEAFQDADSIQSKYNHASMEVDHFLLALLRQSDGVIPPLFDRLGVDRGAIEQALEVTRIHSVAGLLPAGRELLLVCVLKGAVFFLSDLMRQIEVPCEVDFMAVASYGSATDSSGVVRILQDLDAAIEGKDVLIVENIVDPGLTLQ